MNFLDSQDERIKEYYKVLEPDFPEWLVEYINTPELLKQQYISVTCGAFYTNMVKSNFFYSSLDHSIAVALIVWHFTHDKKQTLAGLFHDIATPAFKHAIDFMNGDYIIQESTEDLTSKIISDSKEIMALLNRDGIKLEEVDDYHIYPIADNDTPFLSADRLEYTLSNALLVYPDELDYDVDINMIKEIYDDIFVGKDENGVDELSFKTKKCARNIVKLSNTLSVVYRSHRIVFTMQLIADILKKLSADNIITKADLYRLKESEIIDIMKKSKYKEIIEKWQNAEDINVSKEEPKDVYWVNQKVKVRWIDPLFEGQRMSDACKIAKKMIDKNMSFDMDVYCYLDFNLE